MAKQGGFQRKNKAASEIPSSSLADMAFLLLIFFMVSTTFPKEEQLDITIPEAEATKKLDDPRENILHIWVDRSGDVFINDRQTPQPRISDVVVPLYRDNPALIMVIRADALVPYRFIDGVTKELQQANAVRVTFYTDLEQRVTRRRR